ncbi:MAG: glycosyl transferase family 1 [Acidobacteria bacterium]|nr:MAG: glycosyl transferase family 1 [Acidobacteriota bacterium]
MRILVSSNHHYPARDYPASAGGIASARVTDWLVKGLAELGHEVLYRLSQPTTAKLPPGVTLASGSVSEAEVLHLQNIGLEEIDPPPLPWVKSVHVDLKARGRNYLIRDNWIFVSRTLAESYKRNRYVLNGVDPDEYIYSETKRNYFLFICTLDRAEEKGLDVVLSIATKTGCEIIIAGSAAHQHVLEEVKAKCRGTNVRLVGEIKGEAKAEWLAGAKALLFPTQFNEAFGLVMAEALMSGTPVICSDRGACREIISADVGFVCETETDYLDAINRIGEVAPAACRAKALKDYHYLRMARDYVKEYEKEIERE